MRIYPISATILRKAETVLSIRGLVSRRRPCLEFHMTSRQSSKRSCQYCSIYLKLRQLTHYQQRKSLTYILEQKFYVRFAKFRTWHLTIHINRITYPSKTLTTTIVIVDGFIEMQSLSFKFFFYKLLDEIFFMLITEFLKTREKCFSATKLIPSLYSM